MEIPAKYSPLEVEDKWYSYWVDKKFFHSEPDTRKPYTIVIPPPNVTGVLHMGHMLNNTIQDVLIRRARMTGKNALWVPGTDHASIATEARNKRHICRTPGIANISLKVKTFASGSSLALTSSDFENAFFPLFQTDIRFRKLGVRLI